MRVKTFFGYTAAVLATVAVMAILLETEYFARKLGDVTGQKTAPKYTGGEIVRIIEHGKYKTLQHRTVFDRLVGEKTEGFVQIDYVPLNALPDKIVDDIDFDLDGQADFRLEYNVPENSAVLTSFSSRVISLEGCYMLRERRAVRVKLLNK
jgi:hypothetical protein